MNHESKAFDIRYTRVTDLLLLLAYITLVVGSVLQVRVDKVFAYMDEALVIAFAILAVWQILSGNRRLDRENRRIGICLVVFLAVGMVSTVFCGLERSFKSIAIDLLTCSKFFLMLIGVNTITQGRAGDALKLCASFSRFYLMLMLVFLPVGLVLDMGMVIGERLGYAFLYGHPSNFAAAVVTCLVVVLADRKNEKEFTVIAAVLLIASDRSKAIAFAAVALLVVFVLRKKDKIPIGFWIASGVGSLLIALDQIKLYFFDSTTARSVLLLSSFKVANRFIPLGSGYATFGSNVTISDYSPLYYDLGFERVWGLSPINNDYIADSFWPIVIGQFGYIGLALFLILLLCLIRKAFVSISKGASPVWPICLIVVYLLIASTSESAFFSSYAPGLAMVMGMMMNVERQAK